MKAGKAILTLLALLCAAALPAGCAKQSPETPTKNAAPLTAAAPETPAPQTPEKQAETEASSQNEAAEKQPEEKPAEASAQVQPEKDPPSQAAKPQKSPPASGGGAEERDDSGEPEEPPASAESEPDRDPAGVNDTPAVILPDSQEAPEPPKPGGSEDYSDYSAPTEIQSSEITAFQCFVSLLPEAWGDGILNERNYFLSAELTDGSVQCLRAANTDPEGFGGESFTAGPEFLDRLQEIVAAHNLAQFNGRDRVSYGLPEHFGAELRVVYASGEAIRAGDNSNMFLPLDAVRELVRLFYEEYEE